MSLIDSIIPLATLVNTEEFKKISEKLWIHISNKLDKPLNNFSKFTEYNQLQSCLHPKDWKVLQTFQIRIEKICNNPIHITELNNTTSSQFILGCITHIKKKVQNNKYPMHNRCCYKDDCDESCIYSEDRRRKAGACIGCYYYEDCEIIGGCSARRASGEYIKDYVYDDEY